MNSSVYDYMYDIPIVHVYFTTFFIISLLYFFEKIVILILVTGIQTQVGLE